LGWFVVDGNDAATTTRGRCGLRELRGGGSSGGFGVSRLRNAEERERRDGRGSGEYHVRGTDLPTPGVD
jgi:hypothetical protein